MGWMAYLQIQDYNSLIMELRKKSFDIARDFISTKFILSSHFSLIP